MVNPELRWRGVKEEREGEGAMRVEEGTAVYNVGEKDREGWNDTFIFPFFPCHISRPTSAAC